MSRRYSPKNPRQGSRKGQKDSTSPQNEPPRESRIVCEHYMRQIITKEFDDKFLRILFLGKHEKGVETADKEGMVSRMVECWMNEKAKCGPKQYLQELMEKNKIEREEDGRWAKYKILKAPLVISPRIEVTKPGQWKQLLNLFLNKDFISDQKRTECEVRLRQAKNMTDLEVIVNECLQCQIVVHDWTEFPSQNPRQINPNKERINETYHVMRDDEGLLHHIMLNRSQLEYLSHLYKDPRGIKVVRSNWREYINNIKGGRVQMQDLEEGSGIILEERASIQPQVELTAQRRVEQAQQAISQEPDESQIEEVIEVIKKRQALQVDHALLTRTQLCNQWAEATQGIKWDEEVFKMDKPHDFCAPPNYIGKIPLLSEEYGKGVSGFLKFILKLNLSYVKHVLEVGTSIAITRREQVFSIRRHEWFIYDQRGRYNWKRLTGISKIQREVTRWFKDKDFIEIVDPIIAGCGIKLYVDEIEGKSQLFGAQMVITEGDTLTTVGWILDTEVSYEDFKKQFVNFLYQPMFNGSIVPQFSYNMTLCPFCLRLFWKWQEALGHQCRVSVDLTFEESVHRQ